MNINVTIVMLHYEGEMDALNCMYGGVAGTEENGNTESGTLSLCSPQHIGRSLYSSESKMKIVIYHYKHYSTLNVSLLISGTQCRPIKINDCVYHYLCNCVSYIDSSHILCSTKNLDQGKCAKFLSPLNTNGLAVSHTYDIAGKGRRDLGHAAVQFQMNCIVFQFLRLQKDLHELKQILLHMSLFNDKAFDSCGMQIQMVLHSHGQIWRQLHFRFRGILQPRYSENCGDNLLSRGSEEFELYGKPHKLTSSLRYSLTKHKGQSSLNNTFWKDTPAIGEWIQDFQVRFFQKESIAVQSCSEDAQEYFYIDAHVHPEYGENLMTYIRLMPQTFHSWVELTIRQTRATVCNTCMHHLELSPNIQQCTLAKWDKNCLLLFTFPHIAMTSTTENKELLGNVEINFTFPWAVGSSDIRNLEPKKGFSTKVHRKHIFNADYFLTKSRQVETIFPILSTGVISKIKLTTRNISVGFSTSKYLFKKCNETFREQQNSVFKCYKVVKRNKDLPDNYWILCEPNDKMFSMYKFYVTKYFPMDPLFGSRKPTENVKLFVQMAKKRKRSWIQMLELCRKAQCFSLPVMFDRKMLENIITLMKYSHHVPFMEAVYIGLHYSNSTVGISQHIATVGLQMVISTYTKDAKSQNVASNVCFINWKSTTQTI